MPINKSTTKPDISTIRLFVVDPSMNFRSLIRKSVGGSANIEIVGSAGSYEHGIDAIKQSMPSVILMALPEIRSEVIEQIDEITQFNEHAKFIVSIPKKFTITAIMKLTGLPADVCWRKEFDDDHPSDAASQTSVSDLLRRLRTVTTFQSSSPHLQINPQPAYLKSLPTNRSDAPIDTPRPIAPRSIDNNNSFGLNRKWKPELIAIGSSTGGPDALTQIVAKLDRSIDCPIVITQHMPANFTEQLANRLSAHGKLPAILAEHGMTLEGGKIYIAPGDYHLEIARQMLSLKAVLHQGPKVNSCRPAVDVLFNSVASTINKNALALVLTGMGRDGEDGCKTIRQHGGQVWIQDEASSVIWGMPGAVAKAGFANRELPLNKIGEELNSLMRNPFRTKDTSNDC